MFILLDNIYCTNVDSDADNYTHTGLNPSLLSYLKTDKRLGNNCGIPGSIDVMTYKDQEKSNEKQSLVLNIPYKKYGGVGYNSTYKFSKNIPLISNITGLDNKYKVQEYYIDNDKDVDKTIKAIQDDIRLNNIQI